MGRSIQTSEVTDFTRAVGRHEDVAANTAARIVTDATGAELDELTDGSETTLHSHGAVDREDAVDSVFGRTGDVVAVSGDYDSSEVTENTNLYYTEARVSANTDVAANTSARHAESHSVASHSDTTATGAELDELTDGSVTTLHSHTGALGLGDHAWIDCGDSANDMASYDCGTHYDSVEINCGDGA